MNQIAVLNDYSQDEIKANRKEALEKEVTSIFETYYKRIYNYIYYRVNCHYLTEDLTSKVFEKIILKIESYCKEKAPFEVWLFAIARNVINDHFRSQKRLKIFSLDVLKDLISMKKSPEESIVTAETKDELQKSLQVLDEREKNIIALKFGANLKNKEIAEILVMTESNIGVIIYRAMKKLKKEFEREREGLV